MERSWSHGCLNWMWSFMVSGWGDQGGNDDDNPGLESIWFTHSCHTRLYCTYLLHCSLVCAILKKRDFYVWVRDCLSINQSECFCAVSFYTHIVGCFRCQTSHHNYSTLLMSDCGFYAKCHSSLQAMHCRLEQHPTQTQMNQMCSSSVIG